MEQLKVNWLNDFDSSNVAAMAYDELTKKILVRFHSGSGYEYFNPPKGVDPKQVFNDFYLSESKGKFLNSRIKPYFDYGKL